MYECPQVCATHTLSCMHSSHYCWLRINSYIIKYSDAASEIIHFIQAALKLTTLAAARRKKINQLSIISMWSLSESRGSISHPWVSHALGSSRIVAARELVLGMTTLPPVKLLVWHLIVRRMKSILKTHACMHVTTPIMRGMLPHLLTAIRYPISPSAMMKNIAANTEATMTAVLSEVVAATAELAALHSGA